MLPIPENKANQLNQDKIIAYITQLTETEKQAYMIAYQHLGTSFNILNSNGYKDYIKKNP
jgi:hypothetical protein